MSTIKLKGSSSGEAEVTVAAAAGTPTFTLPTTVGSANQLLKNSGTAGTLQYASIVEDSNGKVGIGATPGQQLHLKAPSNASTFIQIEASPTGDGTAGFIGTIAAAGNLSNGSLVGELALRGSSGISFSANEGSATQLRLASGGNLTLTDGDIILGTSGHGIDFGATSDAAGATSEKLDDYEEGTFTAGIANGTVNSVAARYTKIGNLVTIQVSLNTFSDHTSGNSIEINGFPYTSQSNNFTTGSCVTAYINNNGMLAPYVTGGVTRARFLTFGSGTDYGLVLHSAIGGNDSTRRIFFTISYEAA